MRITTTVLLQFTSPIATVRDAVSTVRESSQRICHENDDAKLCTLSSSGDDPDRRSLLDDLSRELPSTDGATSSESAQAMQDLSEDPEKGMAAYRLFRNLSTSSTFVSKYWHCKPVLLHSDDLHGTITMTMTMTTTVTMVMTMTMTMKMKTPERSWIDGFSTLDHHLRQIHGFYVTCHRTNDVLCNGTRTDTWLFLPRSKPSSSHRT